MEIKKSMDPSQIAMLCTENESIYMKVRAEGEFFQDDNLPENERPKNTVKEPEIPFISRAQYPLEYVLDFLKLAKSAKASHVKICMARDERPLRMEFEGDDKLHVNTTNKTWYYLAPRIVDEPWSPEEIKVLIANLEKEIELLKARLPKEQAVL